MKKPVTVSLAVIIALCVSGCSPDKRAGISLEDISGDGSSITCTFDGVKHDMIVDLPEISENAPLVVMLHGYGGSAESFRTDTAFHERANEEGFAVAYITGACAPDDSSSSTGWNSYAEDEGNRDVEFLVAAAEYLQERYDLDREHICAVGFSNGGFMAHRLAMEAGDTFRAVVSVSGMMQPEVWEKRNKTNNVSFFQITGEKDDVVPKHSDGTAKYTTAPAIEDVMEYWAKSDGLSLTETLNVGKGSLLKKYTGENSGRQVWDLVIRDGRHSWDWNSNSLSDIDTTGLILDFLETQK